MSQATGGPIPDDVRRFTVDHIDSVPSLEALLLMRQSPDKHWTAGMLAAELYMDPRRVAPLLADLAGRGLCRAVPGAEASYQWGPASAELAAGLERLADVYRRHLVPVTNLIHEKPRPSVRGFSDAFRLRGNE